MKKILCALTAAIMLAVQCAAYAETETAKDNAADSDVQLTAVPWETIDSSLTDEETAAVAEAIQTAVEQNTHPEEEGEPDTTKVEIKIPENIVIDETETAKVSAVDGIFRNFLADNPEYFYFSPEYRAQAINGKLSSIILTYKYDNPEEIETVRGEIDEKVGELIIRMRKDGVNLGAITSESSTAEEKAQAQFDAALWLHDYLADTITYDARGYSKDPGLQEGIERSIDAALLDDCLTVCEGYSNAYKYILEKIGMECVNVYSDTEGHEWSAVKIGDAWYYVDVTQDDDDAAKWINHSYFLVTEEELLGGGGTHKDGYITELDKSEMTFGKEFEGALWHGNWQEETPAVGEEGEEGSEGEEVTEGGEGEGEGEESEPKREWHDSVISTRVVFDGNDRYYCGFDDTARKSVIYKCGADLTSPEEFYVMEDGVWYVDPEGVTSRRRIFDYLGGLGKYTYEATGENAEKTCLYFNSPTKIYGLELGTEEVQPEAVYTYVPEEGKNYNCASICGISTYDTLKYQIMDLVPKADQTIGFEYVGEDEETIACNVRLYNGTENPELMDILTYPKDAKPNVPDYKPYGIVIKGWIKDLTTGTPWDFASDTLTESIKLYADTAEAKMGEQPLQIDARDGLLIGTLNASIVDFDDTYSEAPTYILAVYDNNALVAVKTSTDGKFDIAPEDNIPYTETTAIKVYAWSSDNEPYLDGAAVEVIKDVTGGEGEGETGGETGGTGEEGSGTEGETGGTEGETGDGEEGGSDEGEGSETGGTETGDTEEEGSGTETEGGTGSETGSGEGGENTGSGETNE